MGHIGDILLNQCLG